MRLIDTAIAGVKLVEPKIFFDERGHFMETWHAGKFADLGLSVTFLQDNHSSSSSGTLRGLHYQVEQPQGKLVRCSRGAIFDVAVDLRSTSPTFCQWVGTNLSEENGFQMWIPPGFAHGFMVLSERADVCYKCTELYSPAHDRALAWNDETLGIEWPIEGKVPLLSLKDREAPTLAQAEVFE
jgi:dTDP-4-dehydrorhamnose 3,5-epimerase